MRGISGRTVMTWGPPGGDRGRARAGSDRDAPLALFDEVEQVADLGDQLRLLLRPRHPLGDVQLRLEQEPVRLLERLANLQGEAPAVEPDAVQAVEAGRGARGLAV